MIRLPQRRWRTLACVSVGLALIGLTVTAVDQPSAQARPAATSASTPMSSAHATPKLGAYSVTLLTGDRVYVAVDHRGRPAVRVEPVARPDGTIPEVEVVQTDDSILVVPEDVQPALAAGRLDEGLFDVATLIANGYGDRATKTLPVIVQYERDRTKRGLRTRGDELPATPKSATGLASLNATAVELAKRSVGKFWREVRPAQAQRSAATSTSSATLRSGVEKIWLDYKVTATLDESVPQIGAPEAWAAGLDGSGVRVAVLDTGIDETHPDLEGQVVASQSFVGGTVADGHGHGTHVASTIAGSGAASDGAYKGVAPSADLVVGKVLADSGSGDTSGIIAGMEWAAAQQDADVVSMSLGCSECPADGTDPMDQAVDQLTADTGALFVIAAGNSGPRDQTVASPGSADAALTVAAVDKSDQLAGFSSRGPRRGDSAMKPEIAAPGVQIIAARASGTTMGAPVDEHYTAASGTSMATPHVAGAAAILAQRYPDWTASQLKGALMSTAHDVGAGVYEQGAGRVDVGRAVRHSVFATTGTLDFKNVQSTDAPVTKTVSYVNGGDSDATLSLEATAASGNGPVPDGTLTVQPATLTVPAGGTASAEVTLTPPDDGAGEYSGAVVATGSDDLRLSTPVAFNAYSQLTITVDRRHTGADDTTGRVCATVMYLGVDGAAAGASGEQEVCGEGSSLGTTFAVPSGPYFVAATTEWTSGGQPQEGYLFRQETPVGPETRVTLDADETHPLSIGTPREAELTRSVIQFKRLATDGSGLFYRASSTRAAVWMSSAPDPSTGDFVLAPGWSMAAPGTGSVGSRDYFYVLQPYEPEIPDDAHFAYDDSELALVKNYLHASRDGWETSNLDWYSMHEADFNLSTNVGVIDVPLPRVLTVYMGPTSNTDPKIGVYGPQSANGTRAVERGTYLFPEATTYRTHWGEKPVVPGPVYTPPNARLPLAFLYHFAGFLFGGCSGCREGDQLSPFVLMATPNGRNEAGYAGGTSGFEPADSGLDGLHLYGPNGEEIPGRMHYPCDGHQHHCTIGVG